VSAQLASVTAACMCCCCGSHADGVRVLPGGCAGCCMTSAACHAACSYISSDGPGKQQLLAWLASDLQHQLELPASGAAGPASGKPHLPGRDEKPQPETQQQEQLEKCTSSAPHQQQAPRRCNSEGEQQPQRSAAAPPSPAARSCCCCCCCTMHAVGVLHRMKPEY
jgi:hypothetical protein